MPAIPNESARRRGVSFANVSTAAPTGIDTIVPPAPLWSRTSAVSVVISFASFTLASNAVGVFGSGTTEPSTLRPDDEPRIDRAPETTPIGNSNDAPMLANSARFNSARWRDGIAVTSAPPHAWFHTVRARRSHATLVQSRGSRVGDHR